MTVNRVWLSSWACFGYPDTMVRQSDCVWALVSDSRLQDGPWVALPVINCGTLCAFGQTQTCWHAECQTAGRGSPQVIVLCQQESETEEAQSCCCCLFLPDLLFGSRDAHVTRAHDVWWAFHRRAAVFILAYLSLSVSFLGQTVCSRLCVWSHMWSWLFLHACTYMLGSLLMCVCVACIDWILHRGVCTFLLSKQHLQRPLSQNKITGLNSNLVQILLAAHSSPCCNLNWHHDWH